MALPTSGPISIQDIVNEFGGSGTHSLSEYYRGGTYVPNTPANSNIPTSGSISLSNFYGAVASPTISFTGGTVSDAFGATLQWRSDGTYIGSGVVSGPQIGGTWVEPTSAAPDCEVYAEVLSGGVSGTINTWLSTASNWTWSVSPGGFASIRIRVRWNGVEQHSAVFNLG